jgi:putative hydrolase of the HAD superfamily
MPLAAVFLDLGGTLLAERPARAELYAEEGRRYGLRVDAAEMKESMARAHAALPRELGNAFRYSDDWFRAFQRRIFVTELGLAEARFDELSARLFARFEDASSFVLYSGARECLAALRARGLVLGLISNWSARLPRLLRALELERAFDFVLCSAELRMEKPERAIFELALERAGAPAARCLHAGDQVERDALGALGAGLQAVLVDHEGRLDAAARALCPVVSDLAALRDLILERAA